jgi:hypothetical protein
MSATCYSSLSLTPRDQCRLTPGLVENGSRLLSYLICLAGPFVGVPAVRVEPDQKAQHAERVHEPARSPNRRSSARISVISARIAVTSRTSASLASADLFNDGIMVSFTLASTGIISVA